MKHSLIAAFLISVSALPAASQGISVDLGLGAQATPTYPGADDTEISPWFIGRNLSFGGDGGPRDGFSVMPSFSMQGERDPEDDAALDGLDKIDRAYEIGAKVRYNSGPIGAYASVRRGFEGHEGVTGEVGADYTTILSDRVTLTSGLEFGYGNSEFTDTYFGVSSEEAARTKYSEYDAGGGFTSAAIKFQAAYAITDTTSLLGEVSYGKLLGDAGDSPVVQDEWQPALKLGVVRRFSFGF